VKITIFGLTISSSWGNGHATPYRALIRALHRQGHHISFYEKEAPYYRARRDRRNFDYCDLRLYESWEAIRPQALAEAAESDVVINASYCSEGARVADEVLELERPLHVFYDLDTPITLENLGRGDLEYLRREQIAGFDLYLSFTGGEILRELTDQWGANMAEPLYGCVDPDVHGRVAPRDDFQCTLSYMGTYAEDRQPKLEALFLEPARQMPEKVFLLAGSLYPWQWQWPGNVRRHEHVAPSDHAALYCSSRVTLNITRAGMAKAGYCPSGRFFEAAACGTPIVSDYFRGLEDFFEPGDQIVVAETSGDVVHALRHPESLAGIAERARQRTLDEHTGERRAAQLLQYFEQARGSAGQASARAAEAMS